MRQSVSIMDQIDLIAKLADLKEQHYKNTLVLTAVLDLLTEKGLLTEQEIRNKAMELESLTLHEANPIP
jgi:hypothetical protein